MKKLILLLFPLTCLSQPQQGGGPFPSGGTVGGVLATNGSATNLTQYFNRNTTNFLNTGALYYVNNGGIPIFSVSSAGGYVFYNGVIGDGSGLTNINTANLTWTIVQTNFISGFVYTNFYNAPIQVSTTAILTVTTVAGDATLEARAINSATNKYTIQTIVGTLGGTNGSYLAVVVPTSGTYTFTNTSAGSGDSASLQGGQIFVY